MPVCAVPLMTLRHGSRLAGTASLRRQHMLCGAQSGALSVPDWLWGLEASSLQLACSRRDSRRWDMAMGWLGWKVGEPSPSRTGSREAPDSPEDRSPSGRWSAVPPAAQDSAALATVGVAWRKQSTLPSPCLWKGAAVLSRQVCKASFS